jgi:serine/threonine protein phosphatase PrpC
MKRTYAYGAATNQGAWSVQEDGYFADPGKGFFALADGFGGRGGGDIAVKIALQEIRQRSDTSAVASDGNIFSPMESAHREWLSQIHLKLLQWNSKRTPVTRGGCSLLLVSVENGNQVTVTNAGTCSLFLMRSGAWLSVLSAQGPIRKKPNAPLFPYQALGIGKVLSPESRTFSWKEGDLLILFSSGISWERDGYMAELSVQLGERSPGSDLSKFATLATQGAAGELPPWNQSIIAIEALSEANS